MGGGRGRHRPRQGRGRQIPDPAAGVYRRGARRLHRGQAHDLRELGRVPVLPGGWQDRACGRGRQEHPQDLSPRRKGQPEACDAGQCLGPSRQLRDAHGLPVLGIAESGDSGRTARRVGPDHAGPVRLDRDRKGQALCPRCADEGHSDRRRQYRRGHCARAGAEHPGPRRLLLPRQPKQLAAAVLRRLQVSVAAGRVEPGWRGLLLFLRHRRDAGDGGKDGGPGLAIPLDGAGCGGQAL